MLLSRSLSLSVSFYNTQQSSKYHTLHQILCCLRFLFESRKSWICNENSIRIICLLSYHPQWLTRGEGKGGGGGGDKRGNSRQYNQRFVDGISITFDCVVLVIFQAQPFQMAISLLVVLPTSPISRNLCRHSHLTHLSR